MPDRVRSLRTGNWLFVHNTIIDNYGHQLGPYGIALYVALCRWSNNDRHDCYPSHETLAKKTGMSKRQVIRVLKQLEELGLIRWEKQYTEIGKQTSNLYLLLDPPAIGVTVSQGRGDCESDEQDSCEQDSKDISNQSQTQTQAPKQQDSSLVEYELTIDAAAGVLEVAGGKRTVPSESEKNEAFIAAMGNASPPKRIKHTPEEIMASTKRASARGWANHTSSGETTHRAFEKALAKYGDGAPALRELQAQIETSFGLVPNWSSVSKVKEWTSGLNELYAAARGDISIAIAAAKKLRNDSMTMATPYSIVITAQSIAAERATAYVAPSARAVREYV